MFRTVSIFCAALVLAPAPPCAGRGAEPDPEAALIRAYARGDDAAVQSLALDLLAKPAPRASIPTSKLLLLLSSSSLERGEAESAEAIFRGLRALDPGIEASPAYQLLTARAEEIAGNPDKALLTLNRLDSDRALFKTACLLESQGQSYAAILKLQQLLQSFPDSALAPAARLGLARSYLTLREPAAAAMPLEAKAPADLGAMASYLAGSAAYQAGDFGAAQRRFASVDSGSPLASRAQLLEGISLMEGAPAGSDPTGPGEQQLTSLLSDPDAEVAFQAAVTLAKRHLESSEPDKAVAACNAALPALAGTPRRARVLLLRGLALNRAGQTSRAIEDFQEVMSARDPADATPAFVLAAQALWSAGQFDRLTAEFAADLAAYRRRSDTGGAGGEAGSHAVALATADLFIAEAQMAWRRYAEAQATFDRVLSKPLPPTLSANATAGLASALAAQQKFGEAEKRLDELLVRFGEDRAVVRFGLLAQAHLLWNKGDYEKAAVAYAKYAEMFPEGEEAALATYMAGRCRERTNEAEPAFAAWDQLAAQHPGSPYALRAAVRSAALAERTGDNERAQTYYRRLSGAEDARTVEAAMLQLGLARLAGGDEEEAIALLSQFAERYPASDRRAEAAQGIKDAFQRLAHLHPDRLPVLAETLAAQPFAGEAHYWIGMREKEPAKARAHFQKVVNDYPRTPSFARALFHKGQAELEMKDYRQALATLGEFARSRPDHDLAIVARFQRAGALAHAGFPDEAARAYEGIVRDAPLSSYAAQAYLSWARLLEAGGDYDGQARVYESFLREFPADKRANEVHWRMANIKRRAGAYLIAMNYYRKVVPSDGVASADELDAAIQSLEKISRSEARP